MAQPLTPDEAWGGGNYELVIEFGPRSDERLLAALEALWAHSALDGPYLERTPKLSTQAFGDPASGLSQSLWGYATLHDGARVPCVSQAFRAGRAGGFMGEGDVVVFELPVNLAAAWPHIRGFPFMDAAGVDLWQEPLEEWFADIGRAVFDGVRFPLACVGFEISSFGSEEWMRLLEDEIAQKRGFAVLRLEHGDLVCYPTTVWGGPVGMPWEALTDVTPWRTRLRNWLRP